MAKYNSKYTGRQIDDGIDKANTALQEHQQIKTLNNQSLVGEGNIDIQVPTTLSQLSDDSTHRVVTDTEKETWNSKSDVGKIETNGGEIFNVYTGTDKNRALGDCSHAEGSNTKADGDYSHSSGRSTEASSLCQFVIGRCNVEDTNDKYIFIVGNGEENLSEGWIITGNACTIDWDGNVWFQGNIRTGGTSWDSGSPIIGGVGQNYSGGGEIFNEYYLNKASGANSHAERRWYNSFGAILTR